MKELYIPKNLGWAEVGRLAEQPGWGVAGGEEVHVVADQGAPDHIEPLALVMLASWAISRRRDGVRILVDDSVKGRYTWNTNLLLALGAELPWSDEVKANESFYPLCRVCQERRVKALGPSVARLLHIPGGESSSELIKAISEIVRNAEEHSESETAASFACGFFRSQRRVSFAVADTGRGIRRSLLRKRVLNEQHDHAAAIERALQPHVTGAGRPGIPGAPDNAGMGLHNTRMATRDCGGELVIWSGDACFRERGRTPGEISPSPFWQGTMVSVTLYTDRIGVFSATQRSAGGGGGTALFFGEGPPEALELTPPIDEAGFAADKAWYREHRAQVAAALAQGRAVKVAFKGATYSTQSALHALLYEPIVEVGPAALQLLYFSQAGQQVRSVLRLVVDYALERWRDVQIEAPLDNTRQDPD